MPICSICGQRMTEGYCYESGEAYYCSDECLHHDFTDEEWEELYSDDGDSYWTTWEDDDLDTYYGHEQEHLLCQCIERQAMTASLTENKLITMGARAAYMECRGDISLPGGSRGEDELADFVVQTVCEHRLLCDDTPFDEFIETALLKKYGRKED